MSDEPKITLEHIRSAEPFIGMEFTDSEREQMLKSLQDRVAPLEFLWKIKLDNSVPMALQFNPNISDPNPADVPRDYAISPQDDVTRPNNLEDVAFYPVTKLAHLIQTKQVTSVELTEMYLARLKRYNEPLECVVTFTEDLAMKQAKQADAEIADGNYRGPLHGIPWGAKDLLAVKGYKTTWGAMPYKDQSIDLNSAVYERLTEAGAVLIAKLTLGALAYGDIWFGGTTKNPWDINEGSSGSSAGSASATSAGCVGFSIGTETLGSIVSPSTRCGTTGLRPTFGRVSRHGAMGLSWSMDKIGPICRSVEDCALVFTAIYGPDGQDVTVTNHPFHWQPERDPKSLRIGYVKSAFEEAQKIDDESEDEPDYNQLNSGAVLDVLREQGFDLIPIEMPEMDFGALFIILVAEAAATFDEITRDNLDDTMQWQEDMAWPNSFRAARFITAVDYVHATRVRHKLMQEMSRIMNEVDVFVSPTFGGGILHLTNQTGHPCVVVPNGFTPRNTPTSITFIGGLYKEAETLTIAKAYQDATSWHQQYPTLKWD